jgi:hypothetical protein
MCPSAVTTGSWYDGTPWLRMHWAAACRSAAWFVACTPADVPLDLDRLGGPVLWCDELHAPSAASIAAAAAHTMIFIAALRLGGPRRRITPDVAARAGLRRMA